MSRPKNALIVDDEPHVRAFVKLLLQHHGIETTWEAGDGKAALEMIAKHQPDLVMLDVNLPILGGVEVLAALGRERKMRPVIMLSSQSAMKTVLECVKLGAVAYILKHSAREEALRLLGDALEGLEEGEPAGEGNR